jgi:hypothetical protein
MLYACRPRRLRLHAGRHQWHHLLAHCTGLPARPHHRTGPIACMLVTLHTPLADSRDTHVQISCPRSIELDHQTSFSTAAAWLCMNQVMCCAAGGMPGAKADPAGHGISAPAVLLAARSHRNFHLQGWPGGHMQWQLMPEHIHTHTHTHTECDMQHASSEDVTRDARSKYWHAVAVVDCRFDLQCHLIILRGSCSW